MVQFKFTTIVISSDFNFKAIIIRFADYLSVKFITIIVIAIVYYLKMYFDFLGFLN